MTESSDLQVLKIENLQVMHEMQEVPFTVSLPSLSLYQNQITSVTGASGSGKSTLLEVLGLISQPSVLGAFKMRSHKLSLFENKLVRDALSTKNEVGVLPMSGSYTENDRQEDSQHTQMLDLTDAVLNFNESVIAPMRANSLGFILQTGGLLPFLTVKENIFLVRKQKGLSSSADFVNSLISELKMTKLLNKRPHELSIGERQRVAFIRAVAHEPTLVLADEPTAALDPYTADMLFDLLKMVTQELNLSVLLVSHDWQLLKKHNIKGVSAYMKTPHLSEFLYE